MYQCIGLNSMIPSSCFVGLCELVLGFLLPSKDLILDILNLYVSMMAMTLGMNRNSSEASKFGSQPLFIPCYTFYNWITNQSMVG